ncbi:MAG: PucR family transcriptional regulator [Coriobacteriales bacterium]|jgi:hypothetical protein
MITLALLADQLEIAGTTPHVPHSRGRTLKGVRLWATNDANKSTKYLYILIEGMPYKIDRSLSREFDYIFLTSEDPELDGYSYIHIPSAEHDVPEILEAVQNVFDYYNGWSESLLLSAVTKHDIEDLLVLSYPIFKNPIYVVDSAFVLLARTPDTTVRNHTRQWDSIVENGMIDSDLVEMLDLSQIQDLDTKKNAVFIHTVDTENGRNISGHVEKDGVRVASLSIVECNTKMHDYHLPLADRLLQCIKFVIEWQRGLGDTRGVLYEKWIQMLLSSDEVDTSQIYPHLTTLNWLPDDRYQIGMIRFARHRKSGNNSLDYYWMSISRICFGQKCFIFDDSIVLFLHFPKGSGLSEAKFGELAEYVKRNELSCTFSSPFNSIFEARSYYEQARGIQKYTTLEKPVLRYEECMVQNLMDSVARDGNWHVRLHPAVRTMMELEGGEGQQVISTLYEYLVNERSLKKCSEILNLHRSTLVYRLNKIREVYGLDFDDEIERESLLLSCELYLSQHSDRLMP